MKHYNAPRLFFCTGAGVSEESGIPTFRSNGTASIWNNFSTDDVCNIKTFKQNYSKVHEFYDARRIELGTKEPNKAHFMIADIQKRFGSDRVKILTTNVDDLHERAGSLEVIHLHGKIKEVIREYGTPDAYIEDIGYAAIGEHVGCVKPNVIFFNEMAPEYKHLTMLMDAKPYDMMVVIGASNQVVQFAEIAKMSSVTSYSINPGGVPSGAFTKVITSKAIVGMERIQDEIINRMNKPQ